MNLIVVVMPHFVIAELWSKVQEYIRSHERSKNAMNMGFHWAYRGNSEESASIININRYKCQPLAHV